MNTAALTAKTTVTTNSIEAHINDQRGDSLAAFSSLDEGQRASLAVDAWTVGLRALINAHRYAQESRLAEVGKTLLEDVDGQLKDYLERQQNTIAQVLARYFDPQDGQVVSRLDNFLRDGGELTTTMARFLAPKDGEIAKMLARELGENSALLKRLSPTDSEGIVHVLEERFRQALNQNQAALAHALDPLAQDGAVARLLKALRSDAHSGRLDRRIRQDLSDRSGGI